MNFRNLAARPDPSTGSGLKAVEGNCPEVPRRIEGRTSIAPKSRKPGEIIEGIEVRGDDGFRARTREALGLLREIPAFSLVRAHVKVIRQGKRSGMRPWANNPTFVAGRATWQHSALWYAGAIAHDAYHAKLYDLATRANGGREPVSDSWTGADAERRCLAFQYAVLETLDCDENTLRYIARCAENPSYQGRNRGLGSWLDYLRRWW